MRIVAGKYGSRSLKSPKNDATRPTQDKIKGAIFSSLGNMFAGGNFLDCYSGTGNMGLEAVSRGMDHATLVDNNKGAISVIKENVKSLKAEKETKIICGNIFSVLERLTLKYDVVYIDPPYAKQENEKLIQKLEDLDIVKSDGVIVMEEKIRDCFGKKGKLESRIESYTRLENQYNAKYQEELVRNILGTYEAGTLEIRRQMYEQELEKTVEISEQTDIYN